MKKTLKEKINSSFENGISSKLLLLVITAMISFYPFFSIQKKLRETLGAQPNILYGTYIFMLTLVLGLVWIIVKTKPRNN